MFVEIISGCEKIPSKIGSFDRSFTVLLCRMQINSEKMIKLNLMLPERMRKEKPMIFHTLIIDFIGNLLQDEFIRSLDVVLNNVELGNNIVQDSEIEIEHKDKNIKNK